MTSVDQSAGPSRRAPLKIIPQAQPSTVACALLLRSGGLSLMRVGTERVLSSSTGLRWALRDGKRQGEATCSQADPTRWAARMTPRLTWWKRTRRGRERPGAGSANSRSNGGEARAGDTSR